MISELGVHEWMEGKDRPRKENDHACDALSYAVMHLVGGFQELKVRLIGEKADDEDRMWHSWR